MNVLPLEDYKQLFPNQKLEKSRVTLNMYNKVKVVTVGQKSEVMVTNPKNNKSYSLDFQIVERGSGPILGSGMAQEMGFIKVTVNQFNLAAIKVSVLKAVNIRH